MIKVQQYLINKIKNKNNAHCVGRHMGNSLGHNCSPAKEQLHPKATMAVPQPLRHYMWTSSFVFGAWWLERLEDLRPN